MLQSETKNHGQNEPLWAVERLSHNTYSEYESLKYQDVDADGLQVIG